MTYQRRFPNVHDPDIRAMVLRDHQPAEIWGMGGQLLGVHCERCGHEWPCTSIEAARAIETAYEAHGEAAEKRRAG